MAELKQEREKSWRLNDRLLITSQCFTNRSGNTLEDVWIDGPEYLAEDDRVADCTNRFIRLGGIDGRLNQFVACSESAA